MCSLKLYEGKKDFTVEQLGPFIVTSDKIDLRMTGKVFFNFRALHRCELSCAALS